jgi:16S rRNA (cytosine967-C5)-methyltransferase
MTPVRLAAARALIAIDAGRGTLAAALDRERQDLADRRDRGLLVELTTGVLRWRNQLDALIVAASSRPVRRIQPAPLSVLRLAAYQLHHLERIPRHAIVHESVEAVRALKAPRSAGFVNAVLRSMSTNDGRGRLPPRPDPAASDTARFAYLTTTLSHPAWLVGRWLARYGFDATEAWCQFNNAAPELTARPVGRFTRDELLTQLAAAGIDARPAPFVADAIRLPPGALGRLAEPLRAELAVQDEGAQLIARLAAVAPGERVLDVCAAPGGKTLVLAVDMDLRERPRGSLLVAGDRRWPRVSLLAATVARAGVPARIVGLDAEASLPFGPDAFDAVLVDAPCSGLGTLRRDPDLKWIRKEGDFPSLQRVERKILASAAAVVRPGGRVIYATCSSEPEENVEVVDEFLTAHPSFALAGGPRASQVPAALFDARGCLVTTPVEHGLDAFFGAVLVRQPRT